LRGGLPYLPFSSGDVVTSPASISWQRSLRALWLAELVAVAGTNAIMSILPLYLPVLGVQSEQEVRMWAGIVFSVFALSLAVFSPIWGAFSDRYGRKVTVMAAMLGGSLTITLMGSAQNVYQLVLLRGLEGALGGMVILTSSTLVATIVPHERAGYALGVFRTAIYAGASLGRWWAEWWPIVGAIGRPSGWREGYCSWLLWRCGVSFIRSFSLLRRHQASDLLGMNIGCRCAAVCGRSWFRACGRSWFRYSVHCRC
jgi:MFS family permease